MRVAVDVREYSDHPAGIGHYCGCLAASLAETNPGEELFLLGHEESPIESHREGVQVIPVDDRWRAGFKRAWWENVHLPIFLRRSRIDLFHATSHIVPPARFRTKLVVTIHDMTNFLFPEWYLPRNNLYRKRMIRRGIRQADAIIAVSRKTAEDVGNLFPEARAKTEVIYEGVHPDFRPDPDPDAIPPSLVKWVESPFILFIGTLSPRKNIPALMEAFAHLLKIPGCGNYNLVLAGKRGWYDDRILRKPVKLGIEERVFRVGYPSRRTLAELYRRASLFCCLSLYEGFGLPVVEAMASGTPVLVSDRGALPEIVADKVSVVPIGDPQSIAERMAEILLDSTLRERLIRNGLARSRDFSWQKAAESTWRIYRRVLSR